MERSTSVLSNDEQPTPTKEKKTRRRLRLSCVECTKRRQKCDRNHPCSLCVTRGVAHLCRWETVPVARPPPARPPVGATAPRDASISSDSELVAELRTRIVALELEVEESNRYRHSSSTAPSFDSSSTVSTSRASSKARENPYHISSPYIFGPLPRVPPHEQLPEYSLHPDDPLAKQDDTEPLDDLSYEAMSTHAHLALGHHGEFIGRGSLVCALHSVTSGTGPRFLYAKSTDAVSGFRDTIQKFSDIPLATTIEQLISYLPSMLVVESLTNAFMTECNWRYGIPERWFRGARAQMWINVSQPRSSCPDQLNANWLMLLFAMMASAPQSAYDHVGQYAPTRINDDYFMCATMARRFAEDEYLNMPNASLMVSAADGTVLGCLASTVLASYLAERGRVSEAWKLIGHGIRNAEAVGMHRDPEWKLWQMMSADEKVLRRKAWWALFIFDKTMSYALGRPQVIQGANHDVAYPIPLNEDGSIDRFSMGQYHLIRLAEVITEALAKCFNVEYPESYVFLEMDQKLDQWAAKLPVEYQLDYSPSQDVPSVNNKALYYQRYIMHSWYLIGRLKLHIAATTASSERTSASMKETLRRCVLICMRVVRFQVKAYNTSMYRSDGTITDGYPGNCWLFEGCFSLFEASVALITSVAQLSWKEKLEEATELVRAALGVFDCIRQREHGKTADVAVRAIEVITMINAQYCAESRRRRVDLSQQQRQGQLLQQDHYQHNHSQSLPKIKTEPDMLSMGLTSRMGDINIFSTAFSPGTQFMLSSVRDHSLAHMLPSFPCTIDMDGDGTHGDDIRMAECQ